jgi:L-alanine-DL-glutamate epimerase-like enolase superfamily enzyme
VRITSVDPFYLRMPEITTAADGTQDTLLVRIRTEDGLEGWGECAASPLVSLAFYCCPMSHGDIINLRETLLGETVGSPADLRRLHRKALLQGMDIQQIHHAYSRADIALWDLLGKQRGQPVFRLLGAARGFPKRPYASVLFGDTPVETRAIAESLRDRGFRAAKFGLAPMGKGDADQDEALVRAARKGLGESAELMVDAGRAWGGDDAAVVDRCRRFAPYRLTWLEEPLHGDAIPAYARLSAQRPSVPIAAGESAGCVRSARRISPLGLGGQSHSRLCERRPRVLPGYPHHRLHRLIEARVFPIPRFSGTRDS